MKNYFNIFEHHETPEIAGVSSSEMLVDDIKRFIKYNPDQISIQNKSLR